MLEFGAERIYLGKEAVEIRPRIYRSSSLGYLALAAHPELQYLALAAHQSDFLKTTARLPCSSCLEAEFPEEGQLQCISEKSPNVQEA